MKTEVVPSPSPSALPTMDPLEKISHALADLDTAPIAYLEEWADILTGLAENQAGHAWTRGDYEAEYASNRAASHLSQAVHALGKEIARVKAKEHRGSPFTIWTLNRRYALPNPVRLAK